MTIAPAPVPAPTPAPVRAATMREKVYAGLGLILLVGTFLFVSAMGGEGTRRSLQILAAVLAVVGTLIQMFLASHWASAQRDGETVEKYGLRLARRDRWEAYGWGTLCLGVIMVAATQFWN